MKWEARMKYNNFGTSFFENTFIIRKYITALASMNLKNCQCMGKAWLLRYMPFKKERKTTVVIPRTGSEKEVVLMKNLPERACRAIKRAKAKARSEERRVGK